MTSWSYWPDLGAHRGPKPPGALELRIDPYAERADHRARPGSRPKRHAKEAATPWARARGQRGKARPSRPEKTDATAQSARKRTHRQSPRPEPAQSLRRRVVVNAEMLRDPADGDAALVHRGNVRRDRLVDGRLKAREELSLNRNLGDGAKPLRTRQRFVHGAEDHSHRRLGVHRCRGRSVRAAARRRQHRQRRPWRSRRGLPPRASQRSPAAWTSALQMVAAGPTRSTNTGKTKTKTTTETERKPKKDGTTGTSRAHGCAAVGRRR